MFRIIADADRRPVDQASTVKDGFLRADIFVSTACHDNRVPVVVPTAVSSPADELRSLAIHLMNLCEQISRSTFAPVLPASTAANAVGQMGWSIGCQSSMVRSKILAFRHLHLWIRASSDKRTAVRFNGIDRSVPVVAIDDVSRRPACCSNREGILSAMIHSINAKLKITNKFLDRLGLVFSAVGELCGPAERTEPELFLEARLDPRAREAVSSVHRHSGHPTLSTATVEVW